jgi:nucleotide-binding universal stress UspA family protein
MKYRKILLAYNGSQEGKRALLECADLASFLGAETHLLAVASMPPSLFLTEGFVPEELLEEEKKRTQTVLDEGIRTPVSYTHSPSPRDRQKSRMPYSA